MATFSSQPSTGNDTIVAADNATYMTRNFGATDSMRIRPTPSNKGLLHIDCSSIPASATCNSATLYLYHHTQGVAGAWTLTAYSIASGNAGWIEGTKNNTTAGSGEPCWNAKEADGSGGVTTAWAGSAGLATSGTDYEASAIGSVAGDREDAVGTEYAISLNTTRVAGWFGSPNTNYGMLLMVTSGGATEYLCSSEHATAGYRPKIVIEYTEAGPQQAAGGAWSGVGTLARAIAKAVGGAWSGVGALVTDPPSPVAYVQDAAGAMANSGAITRGTSTSPSGALASPFLIGLVTYWPLSEASGNRADVGGNAYTLTDTGAVPSADGVLYAKAADFDMTVDKYLTRARADAALINFGVADAFTLAAWVYPTAWSGGPDAPDYYRTVMSFNGGSSIDGGYRFISTSGGQLYVKVGSSAGIGFGFAWHTGLTFTLDQWQLVIVAYDGPSGAAVARINTSQATDTNADAANFIAATDGNFSIGAQEDVSGHVYDGRIGPAMIWSRVLSSAEMTALYNSGAGWPYAAGNLAGGVVRGTATSKAGAWSGAGDITRGVGKAAAGAWSGAGAITRGTSRALAGAWSGAGAIARGIGKALAGAWSGAGSGSGELIIIGMVSLTLHSRSVTLTLHTRGITLTVEDR